MQFPCTAAQGEQLWFNFKLRTYTFDTGMRLDDDIVYLCLLLHVCVCVCYCIQVKITEKFVAGSR